MKTKIATDTATIVVFDPLCLKHRRSDDCDWWSIEREEMVEVNEGNALFVGVGSDGAYEIEITDACPPSERHVVVAHLKVESGKVFVGAGEWTTGGELEPEALYGSVFVDIPAAHIAFRHG